MRTAYKQVMVGSFAALLAGCGGGSDGVVNANTDIGLSMKRVYVDAATQEQWDSILVACGDNGAMNCAVVCHVPPGNPDNRHTITVGVNAVKAHLRHTHADRKNGAIGDYLGDCNASPDDGDDSGDGDTDPGTSTGGDTGGGTMTDPGTSTGGDTGGGTTTPEPSPTPAPSPAPEPDPNTSTDTSTDTNTAMDGTDTSSGGYVDYYEPVF